MPCCSYLQLTLFRLLCLPAFSWMLLWEMLGRFSSSFCNSCFCPSNWAVNWSFWSLSDAMVPSLETSTFFRDSSYVLHKLADLWVLSCSFFISFNSSSSVSRFFFSSSFSVRCCSRLTLTWFVTTSTTLTLPTTDSRWWIHKSFSSEMIFNFSPNFSVLSNRSFEKTKTTNLRLK